jgi:hypothetical protein
LNWDIVDVMSTVKELTLSPEGTVDAAALDEAGAGAEDDAAADDGGAAAVVDDVDDEQPAATTATAAAAATAKPSRGRGLPPCPLLPTCIPYPFHRNAVRSYTTMRTPHITRVLRDER